MEMTAPRKASPVARVVLALAVIGVAVPIGVRIKSATAQQKAMEEGRKKTAEEAAAKANAPLSAKVVRGVPETWQPTVPFDGTLQPIQEASLAFKATGPLSQLKVKVGDFVQKGALLGALDGTEAGAQAAAASAQIKAAKASLALAKDSAERTAAMVKSGSAPAMQETQANGQLDLTAAQLEGAQAQLALASANLRNHTLAAPFAGFVTQAPSAIGGLVAAGTPVFHLKDVSRLKLVGSVSDLDVSLVKVGAEVVIDLPGRTIPAKVVAVLPSVDPQTRRIPVEAELENDKEKPLFAGTFVRSHIAGRPNGEGKLDVLRFPASALRPGSQDELMVVEKGKLRAAKVIFTRDANGALLVRSGVTAKDDVYANPAPEAKDGDPVTVE
jgi:cobalt-zinc-cadmium efflux system membrane fusion protein